MTSVKEVLETLPEADKSILFYAFEHDMSQIIQLPDGRYIGVNADRVPNATPELTAGKWSVGKWRH